MQRRISNGQQQSTTSLQSQFKTIFNYYSQKVLLGFCYARNSVKNLMTLAKSVCPQSASKSRPPPQPAVVSAGHLHRPVAEQKTKTDPQPCSSTESHEELRTCNKALRLSRHCAPGLHLIECVCLYVLMDGTEN